MALPRLLTTLALALTVLLIQVNASLVIPKNITITGLTSNWTYSGCYTDNVNARSLAAATYANTTGMTDESCIAFCYNKGYNFAGAEYGQECYCDNSVSNVSTIANDTDCSMSCSGNSSEACGGSSRLSLYWSGKPSPQGPVTNPGPGNWSSLGCFNDSNARTLSNAVSVPGGSTNMTVEDCTYACNASGYKYAGIEYAAECYCDNQLNNNGQSGYSGCTMLCNGNSSEFCGGSFRLNVYVYNTTKAALASLPSSTKSSSTTSVSIKTSSSTAVSSSTSTSVKTSTLTTLSSQTSTRIQASSPPSSTSSSSSSIKASSTPTSSSSSVKPTTSTSTSIPTASSSIIDRPNTSSTTSQTLTTTTSASTTSGFSQSRTITTVTASTSLVSSSAPSSSSSSFSSKASSATTSATSIVSTTTSSKVVATAAAPACPSASGAIYIDSYAANYSIYCSSDTSIGSYGNAYAPDNYTECAALCDASSGCVAFVYQGGTNGIGGGNCYFKSSLGSVITGGTNLVAGVLNKKGTFTSTSSSSATSPSASGTSTSSVKPPTATGLPSGWKYSGCYVDNANGRILANQIADNTTLTVESCVSGCASAGYTVAGMEYSTQCFCDNAVIDGGALSSSQSDCSMACGGNSAEICGAGNRMSIYYTGNNLTTVGVPVAQSTGLNGSWTYAGCLSDNGNPRTFPYQMILSKNNSANNCLTQCSNFGFMYGGMEYGDECYCGDLSDITAAGATVQPESGCNMACSGDAAHLCGGASRISYYKWTGTPLYTWNYPQGAAAGQYQFLIGGVTIPLITSQTILGKVTFLEKFGTGPGNDTGAYELDLTQINNSTAAWRPMHVKTDVFCSAGLTLPDRVGRQINVGGWSADSLLGVRLYWPDGGPGVWGKNDWQENVNELALQNGRWYPTGMIMANGSILVVGGEDGSNGAPVPTLEILPTVGPVVECDWLKRTDPNNLYPYLAVVPSGVFVAYYNEARILDEKTFATIKTMPNIPGAVNNFLGGRTYPLEGTAVLMPQHAPYSDPLAVMICGGSTPYAGDALDNCVTIQPEAANPQWVLERMPSKRVISCMTALPDGTYLILNGAQQGQAGFGLATNPNLNAVLYDPSQPVGARMSVMANTTVARLYHSEAILLQDGRVLVSGSDPEDNVHPEEYRVEVFVPPYLMNNPTRPTFKLASTDWAYGSTVSFTLGASGSNIRVSLIGGDSSTHGNSMGQRTFFPAASCSGTSCTVTAPPNAHICPPGWYQMFVLNGPTPSISTYVRIGGDPASLGNWPNFPDFSTPGVGAV